MPLARLVAGEPEVLPAGMDVRLNDVDYSFASLLIMAANDELPEGVLVVEPPALTLDDLKAERGRAVTAKREAVFAAGFTPSIGPLSGHTLQVRNDQDKINWLTSQASYAAAVGAGAGAVSGATFRTADNETVVVTYAQGLTVIVQDMAAWGAAIMARSWVLKDEIEAAEDEAALDAIDINTGWPE